MPVYAYEDKAAGLRIELRRPVADRDKPIVLERAKNIPDRVTVVVPGATEAGDFNQRMIRAHHKKEEREGSRFRSAFSKETIKHVWSN